METRTKTLGELHDYLASLGYEFEGLSQRDDEDPTTIRVRWGKSQSDESIQAHINSFVWQEEYETANEKLTRLENEIETLKRR